MPFDNSENVFDPDQKIQRQKPKKPWSKPALKATQVSKFSDLFQLPSVPDTLTNALMGQISGSTGDTLIEFANFDRISDIKAIEKKRKKEMEESPFGRALHDFQTVLREISDRIDAEIDDINHLINLARRGKATPAQLAELERYRNHLRGYKDIVGWYSANAYAAGNEQQLNALRDHFEATHSRFTISRESMRNALNTTLQGFQSMFSFTKKLTDDVSKKLQNVMTRVL